MTIIDRWSIRVFAVGVGLCGAAMAFSPSVAAAPLKTGGACLEMAAGQVGAAGAEGCGAPIATMSGVPLALPGPPPVAPPLVPPVPPLVPPIPPVPPLVPPVPPLVPPIPPVVPPIAGAPVAAAPAVVGAPLTQMAGGFGGKGDVTAAAPEGGPMPGEPTLPGPSSAG